MSTAVTTTTDRELCDLSVVSSPTLEQSLANPDFAEFIKAFAINREHHRQSEATTLQFPVDASLGTTFDRVDPTLREKYTASVVDFAKDSECEWNEEQLKETAIGALEGVGISAGEHDRRLWRYTNRERPRPLEKYTNRSRPLEELTKQTIPKMGQLVMIEGRPGIIQRWRYFCLRSCCTIESTSTSSKSEAPKSRPFKAGEKPVPYKGGWAHAKIRDNTRPPEPVTAIPSSCGTCKQSFKAYFVTSIMGTAPQHIYFDEEGRSSFCRAITTETRQGSSCMGDTVTE